MLNSRAELVAFKQEKYFQPPTLQNHCKKLLFFDLGKFLCYPSDPHAAYLRIGMGYESVEQCMDSAVLNY